MFAARAALLACVGGLAFLMRACLRWFPAQVSDCMRMLNQHVSLYQVISELHKSPSMEKIATGTFCNLERDLYQHHRSLRSTCTPE